MGNKSRQNGAAGEEALAWRIREGNLGKLIADAYGSAVTGASVIANKRIKPDLAIEIAHKGLSRTVLATVKSAEAGGSGHAARFAPAKLARLAGMDSPEERLLLSILSDQEWEFASAKSRAAARQACASIPARAIASLAMKGAEGPSPELMIALTGGPDGACHFGLLDALLACVPEKGGKLIEPASSDSYVSVDLGGLFSLKRSSGTGGSNLQVTVKTKTVAKFAKFGAIQGWRSCPPETAPRPNKILLP